MAIKDKFYQRVKRVLVKQGAIEEAKAEEAIAIADKEDAVSYSSVLLEHNYIDEMSFLSAIASETNNAPIDLEKTECEEDALQVINQEMATYYSVLPLTKVGNILTLAVGNPFDILRLDELRTLTNCDLRVVVSTERTIKKSITRAYSPDDKKLQDMLSEAEKQHADEAIEVKEQTEDVIDLSKEQQSAAESPTIAVVNMLVVQALRNKASDIHIEPFERHLRVRLREDGVLKELEKSPPKSMLNAIISRIKIMSNLDIAERRVPQDGKFQVKYEGRQVDFRVSILPTIHGEKAVLRVLDSGTLSLGINQLGFESEAEQLFRTALAASYGMLLVTGPTGSGKSTTLYASLREVLNPEENVCTVEDPVEYQLEGVIQVPVNVKRGLTFASALRSLLRQDPDTIMIGEIRDFETADIAVKAAITGHLVFSTLHTNDAASAITRLVDMGIDAFMVSSSVIMVAAQRLCRRLCDKCKQPLDPVPVAEQLLKMGFLEEDLGTVQGGLMRPVGCGACVGGYKGRFAILEALEITEDIRRFIIEGKSAMDLKRQAKSEHNMITLRRCALLNALRGRTSLEETLRMTMPDD